MENSWKDYMSNRRRFNLPLQDIYPIDIQFYKNIPCSLPMEKLKELVEERITALKEIYFTMRDLDDKTLDEKREDLTKKLRIMHLHKYANFINSRGHKTHSNEELDNRIADHASFVALRLAVAFDKEKKYLHQKMEEELFNFRVSALDDEGIRELLAFNRIDYEKIDNDERIELKDQLIELLDESEDYDSTDFFKIPISTILKLIKGQEIYMKDGIVFAPLKQMRTVLSVHYHEYLTCETASVTCGNLRIAHKYIDGYDKFNNFFDCCREKFKIMQGQISKESNLSIKKIHELAETAFPPCMRAIHENLHVNHHLKHAARFQYTLFLKGIGLNVQDTIELFRREFTKTVTVERFNKEYSYYILHAYGMKGRNYDTPPKDCIQLINSAKPIDDCNGCIFTCNDALDIEELGKKMVQWNIPVKHVETISQHTKAGDYGSACAAYFHAITNCAIPGPVTHPNIFFNESRRLSNLPAGCATEESDDSDHENGDNKTSMPTVAFDKSKHTLIKRVIDLECEMQFENLKGGSLVKLKHII